MMTVTAEAYPFGVRCGGCGREIQPGEPYKLRDLTTARLSVGPPTEDRADGVFCEHC